MRQAALSAWRPTARTLQVHTGCPLAAGTWGARCSACSESAASCTCTSSNRTLAEQLGSEEEQQHRSSSTQRATAALGAAWPSTQPAWGCAGIAASIWHTQPPAQHRAFSVAVRPQEPEAPILAVAAAPTDASGSQEDPEARMTPQAVVDLLDRYIIGQDDAKRAVAVAYRNRWRRKRVPESIRNDIVPKNILLIGPTGCGKTEIARRLAKLADSPFVKVEATKFTEVGYHGRDVDTIIRDLLEVAMGMVRNRLRATHAEALRKAVEDRILKSILGGEHLMGPNVESMRAKLRNGEMDETYIEVDLSGGRPVLDLSGGPMVINLEKLMAGAKRDVRTTKIKDARPLLEDAEAERMFPPELLVKEAITATEQDGIVFIDEIDKIVSGRGERSWRSGDPSSEGVQRDLLPIIEGSVVSTKHGNVATDHILFICSGAFHQSKPSDLMPELQGRLPIRVELKPLTRHDFYRILTEPEYNLIKQQQVLLAAEGVDLHFTPEAVQEMTRVAEEVNMSVDNIGARRLHAVLERVVEEVSFNAPELVASARAAAQDMHACVIDKEHVVKHLSTLLQKQDLSKFIM